MLLFPLLKLLFGTFFLLIEGFAFLHWISIFKRLILDLSKNPLELYHVSCVKKIINCITFSTTVMLSSCVSDIDRETLIYDNNFETVDLTKIEGGIVTSYLGQNILGTYNNGGFKLTLEGLGTHDYVQIQAL
ncbi:MAG: hypothetical protein P8N26_12830, partial [Cyclobacteriaceae bacterium]|nr:hypothetical protein [Cyclobacteriaceae bacterium]